VAIVTLTTDFGTVDGYVGAMKGVILGIAPDARLVDLTHEVPPQDVRSAAFALMRAVPSYPAGSVHCVVVDPGVGTARRPVVLRTSQGQLLVGPDSGVFTLFLPPFAEREPEAFELTESRWWRASVSDISSTFHGRDIFAPVAAHLVSLADRGEVELAHFGRFTRELTRFDMPEPFEDRGGWGGEVVNVDHFGNAITNLPERLVAEIGSGATVEVGDHEFPLVRTYSDIEVGEMCALVGSSGWLEIAERDGSAADRLGLAPGIPVLLKRGAR
jgi:S-adenosylmethionine hydrolase